MRYRLLLFLVAFLVLLMMSVPAAAEWPADFSVDASLHQQTPSSVEVDAQLPFYRYLTPDLVRAGSGYMKLTDVSMDTSVNPQSIGRPRISQGVHATAVGQTLVIKAPAQWSVALWWPLALDDAYTTFQARISLRHDGSGVERAALALASHNGQRLEWKEIDLGRKPGTASVLTLEFMTGGDPGSLALWLLGTSQVAVLGSEVRGFISQNKVKVFCSGSRSVTLEARSPVLKPETWRPSADVKASVVGSHAILIDFPPNAGWAGVGVPISGSVASEIPGDSEAAITIIDTGGMRHWAVELFDDSSERRIEWLDQGQPLAGKTLLLPLSSEATRIGIWNDGGVGAVSPLIEIKVLSTFSIVGIVPRHSMRCYANSVDPQTSFVIRSASAGLTVQGSTLMNLGFGRRDALFAWLFVGFIAAIIAFYISVRHRSGSRRGV